MTTDANSSDIRSRLRVPMERLTTRIDENQLGFTTTREVSPLEGTIGQERALRALEFGLGVDAPGFNIYVAGIPGSGRNTTLANYLQQLSAGRPIPNDWAYVYNFTDPMKPRGLNLPAGMARRLHQDMQELVAEVTRRVPKAFESEDYQRMADGALADVHSRHRELTEEMVAEARRRGVGLSLTDAGVIATPLGPDGDPVPPDQLKQLSKEQGQKLQEQQRALQEFVSQRMTELRALDREAGRIRQQVTRDVGQFIVETLFAELQETFASSPATLDYLAEVQEDMIENIRGIIGEQPPTGAPAATEPRAGTSQQHDRTRYAVNVFVDNSRTTGAPVIFERSPSFYNVFGRVEHRLQQGVMSSDFTMVQPGSIHAANGGFLVFQVKDLLTSPMVWQTLKQALSSQQARIESIGEQIAMMPTPTLQPEAIPLAIKVVLVGNPSLARTLQLQDEDFHKLFKVKADFGYDLDLNDENVRKYARFVVNRVQEEGLNHFDASAVARLIEYSSRLVDDQEKLTTQFAEIADLATEATYWARQSDHDLVTGDDILQAIHEKRQRSNLVEERLQELYENGTVNVAVSGSSIGEINGLAVINMGDYSFGRPSRLSATVALGRGEFANVEHASQMSGRIHTKGFQILIGYLMGKYGSEATLPLRASIAFEQTYEEIDGDSASSTELYAVLSSLSDVPIDQGLAVTGSVDQQGQIQAIGGATRKIEGFFDVCQAKGLTGRQGVMIPATNVRNLVLRRDVTDAVSEGRFHVYAVRTVEEGIELLTGVPAGEVETDGGYPEGTINAKVIEALAAMSGRLREPERVYRSNREGERPIAYEREERQRDPREAPGEPPAPPPA